MKTKIVEIDEKDIDKDLVKDAGEVIKRGGLVAFPTETVYGLGANALDSEAVKKIFIAKGRPQDNPLIVHISKLEEIYPLVTQIPDIANKLFESFWPGPMTVILKKSSLIPLVTTSGLDCVGIRLPSNIIARQLIQSAGVPIAAPSANLSGKPSPTYVQRCIEDLDGKIDYILGGKNCRIGLESTVIDCTVKPPCILRPGAITLEMFKKIDDDIYIDPAVMEKPDENMKPKAPGMKYRHYAPKAPVKIIIGDVQKTVAKINEIVQNYICENKVVGIMATDETFKSYKYGVVLSLGSRNDMLSIASNLFETLRSFDDRNVDVILSEGFEEIGLGVAVMNRLKKSSGFNIIQV